MPELARHEAAREKFIRALRQAKRDGVNVDDVFAGEKERLMLSGVKIFGVGVSIVWGFAAPLAVTWLKYDCIKNHIEHSWIPLDLAYWMTAIGWLSMIAFAFNLVDINDFLPRLPFRNSDENPKPGFLFIPEQNTDDADGDV